MQFPSFLRVYGDQSFRGQCPPEDAHLTTFFNQLRKSFPEYDNLVFHPKNEGKKTLAQAQIDKAKGQKKGVSDIIGIGKPALVIELKRLDHTQSGWETGQLEFLENAYNNGAFVCVALGHVAALHAFHDWLKIVNR